MTLPVFLAHVAARWDCYPNTHLRVGTNRKRD